MQIENIEQWVGREVIDAEGETVGKLEEVYFRGDDAVLAEIKSGMLARKRVIVPLAGASVSREFVRLDLASSALMQERSGGAGPDDDDLAAIAEHYGQGHQYSSDELASSTQRKDAEAERLAAQQRADDLEAEAERRRAEEQAAHGRLQEAQAEVQQAESTRTEAEHAAREARGG